MTSGNERLWAKYIWFFLLAALLPCLAAGQTAPTSKPVGTGSPSVSDPQTSVAPDPVVLKIGATQITRSEMEALFGELPAPSTKGELSPEGRTHLAELYVRIVLLSQQAVNDHLDTSPAMRHRLEMQRARLLAQVEYDKMRGAAEVAAEEIAQYYADHHLEYDTVQVREFLVRKRAKDSAGSESGLSPEDASAKAESIRKALAAGDSAEKVSEDLGSSDVLLIDAKPRTLKRNEMVPALEQASFAAKDGGVAGPVDTPDALLVVLVLKHGHIEEPEAATEIAQRLRTQKLEAEVKDLEKKAGVWMSDTYFKKDQGVTPTSVSQPPAPSPKP